MKKRIISILAVCCLMVTMVPAAFAAGTDITSEAELRSAVEAGGTVTLGADITISTPLSITKGTTINGQDHAINYTGNNAANACIEVTTNDQVTLQNLTINATSTNGRAIKLESTSPKFTLQGSVLNVGQRGIWVGNSGCGTGSVITVTNSIIKNSQLPESKTYDNWVAYGTNYRGISLWNMNNAEATITNCQILGFSYGLYAGGETNGVSGADYNGSTIDVTDTIIKGWAAYYLWGANSVTSFTDCTLVGISDISGASNNFAVISAAEEMYINNAWNSAIVQFYGGSITGVRYNTAYQALFNVDRALKTEFEFLENNDNEMPQLRYYDDINEPGATEYFANVWNFYPGTGALAENYLNTKVSGYSFELVTFGTTEDYENSLVSVLRTAGLEYQLADQYITWKEVHEGEGL